MADAPSAGEVVAMFPYSTDAYFKAIEQMREFRLLRAWFLLLSVFYLFTLGVETWQGSGESWISILLNISLAVGGALFPSFLSLAFRARYRRNEQEGSMLTFRFGSNGFAFAADRVLTPWGLLDTVSETTDGFLLKDALSNWPMYLPKSALTNAQQEQLKDLLGAAFRSRPKKFHLLNRT